MANRTHIALFGGCNVGKSTLINALTGQDLAIVSPQKGTTTDPVYKTMELLPLGPVVLIDTPGLDDDSELGEQRIEKALRVLDKSDIAILVCDTGDLLAPDGSTGRATIFPPLLLERIHQKKIPTIIVCNQFSADGRLLPPEDEIALAQKVRASKGVPESVPVMVVSALHRTGIQALKEQIAVMRPLSSQKALLEGMVSAGDLLLLVVPIDSSAPKGRLILPQQQVLRDILDAHATAMVLQPEELPQTLSLLAHPPRMVITDSQVFEQVFEMVPATIPLTSFSILFARYKGDLAGLVAGVKAITLLQSGDDILIAEGCTHHRQCDDIGTVKIPRWLRRYTQKELNIHTVSGTEFPAVEELRHYRLVIHCGGCMLPEREMKHRMALAEQQQVPMINYGALIAFMTGQLDRAIAPFEAEAHCSHET